MRFCILIGFLFSLDLQAQEHYLVFDRQVTTLAGELPLPEISYYPVFNGNEIRIPVSRDGHFYLSGYINGYPVVFMLDTGASETAIPMLMARNAGIRIARKIKISTASGEATSGLSSKNKIALGSQLFEADVVLTEKLNIPLLGMNILKQFKLVQEKGWITLSRR